MKLLEPTTSSAVAPSAAPARVGIDTTGVYVTQAGIARHVRGLLRGLRRVADPDFTFLEVAWPVENFAYRQPQRALKTAYRELIFGPYVEPRLLKRHDAQILHQTSSLFVTCPPGVKHVITLHDLTLLRHPERFRTWQVRTGQKRLRRVAGADHVICISQFTADEAMRLLDLPASKIHIVHNGCDIHPDEPAPASRRPDFDVPEEFFLFVGSLEPGKNLALLKRTYLAAAEKNTRLPPLLIVGARWAGTPGEGPPPDGWHYLGRQPDDVLMYLYEHARALLFPSVYEGFGLPVVEAMALRCPVVCSPVASLPEIGGDAALFTPLTHEGYLDAATRLLREPGLRDHLVTLGVAQAEKFSWNRCARETLNVYRTALGSA